MNVLNIVAGGGLGDFIFHYFNSYAWNCIPTIKKHYPDVLINVVLACHHPSVGELVYSNPYIDSVLAQKWYPPGHVKERQWKHLVQGEMLHAFASEHELLPSKEHGLHLIPQELEIIKSIRARTGKFIVMHPFAGMPHRGCKPHPYDGEYKCYPDYKYAHTANYLAEKGYTVVIVGKTSFDGFDVFRSAVEEFDTPVTLHPNVLNLVNRLSIRTNVELCRQADGFIGTHSSMLSAAWTNEVPSVFFYPLSDEHGNSRNVRSHGGTTGTWALDRSYHNYFEMTGLEFLRLDARIPAKKLLEHME